MTPRIEINVSGEIFQTSAYILSRFPESLLGDEEKRSPYYCSSLRQYFFDRNRRCFEEILCFYQNFGKLSCPIEIDVRIFVEECKFYELPEDAIDRMKFEGGILPDLQKIYDDDFETANKTTREKMWDILDNPGSSTCANLYTVFSLIAIFLAILLAVFESVESFKFHSDELSADPWAMAELLLNLWFMFELVLRFVCSPSKRKFLLNWINWVDAAAVIPYFVMLIFYSGEVSSLGFLRILRLVRVLRLFKLSKHSKRLQVVAAIIAMSRGDFGLLMICLIMLVTLSGSFMYYIEGPLTPGFSSIPESLWWGMITVTTVGYGDVYSMTIPGQIFSGFLMIFGALTMSIPVLAIVTNFELFYEKNAGAREGELDELEETNDTQTDNCADIAISSIANSGTINNTTMLVRSSHENIMYVTSI